MKPVPVRVISVLKACRNHLNVAGGGGSGSGGSNISSQLITRMGMGLMAPPQNQIQTPTPTLVVGDHGGPPHTYQQLKPPSSSSSSYGNPCLDFFFNVVKPESDAPPAVAEANQMYLNKLLPLAWYHNPLTTLKLICNLLHCRHPTGKYYEEAFDTAASWLHHNHPKTLASNLLPIAGSFGGMSDLVRTLCRILAGQDMTREISAKDSDWSWYEEKEKMFAMANAVAVERYQRDPNFHLLHDSVSDLFTHCLKHDIQTLKKQMDNIFDDQEECKRSEITLAADYCDEQATLLFESVAKKVYPLELCPEYQGLKEADYTCRVRQRLKKEVLVPLVKASDNLITGPNHSNEWGYDMEFDREPCLAKKYLEDVKSSGGCESKIEAGALLPHQIIGYVDDEDVGEVAELQWKAMLEDMMINFKSKTQGIGKKKNLNNSLAVCNVKHMFGLPMDVTVGLGLLLSELNEEPAWKGKVINSSQNPKLHSIQGLDDLRSKCAFVKSMDCNWEVDFKKVFDLILEVAVNRNLKPEQMINKVFVFTGNPYFDVASGFKWESDYEAIQSKFKEKGYAVPHLLYWNVLDYRPTPATRTKQGVAMFSGFSDELVKSFLDNDGEMGPEEVMEAAISSQPYQTLVVVD